VEGGEGALTVSYAQVIGHVAGEPQARPEMTGVVVPRGSGSAAGQFEDRPGDQAGNAVGQLAGAFDQRDGERELRADADQRPGAATMPPSCAPTPPGSTKPTLRTAWPRLSSTMAS